jgi:hypothetical protein
LIVRKKKEGYYHVGDMLRDELIAAIDALGWEGEDKDRAAKVKSALQLAAPHRGGYLLDVHGWTRDNKKLLKSAIDSITWNNFLSRGFSFGKTPLGQQIQTLREKL